MTVGLISETQKRALQWLRDHNGDGYRTPYGTIIAGGEESPHGNQTWPKLETAGLVERYGPKRKRIRLTEAGCAHTTVPDREYRY